MMTKTKMSLVAALVAAVAVPAIASADHDRRSDSRHDAARWIAIGEVGTHAHDDEDFVTVKNQRFTRIELTAEGQPIRLDDVRFQLTDGRIVESRVQRTLHDGQSIVLDVPGDAPIKMLILDYANRGPFYRGHEDSRLAVRGLTMARNDRYDDRYEGSYRDRRDDRVIVQPQPRPRPQPYPYVPRPAAVNPGVRIQGGVQIRF